MEDFRPPGAAASSPLFRLSARRSIVSETEEWRRQGEGLEVGVEGVVGEEGRLEVVAHEEGHGEVAEDTG